MNIFDEAEEMGIMDLHVKKYKTESKPKDSKNLITDKLKAKARSLSDSCSMSSESNVSSYIYDQNSHSSSAT